MGRLATILGSNALGPAGNEPVEAAAIEGVALLQRHGPGEYRLPHLIDHEANLRSLLELGCDRVLAIGSVGSLRPELPVGSFVCPNDFIALQLGLSIYDDSRGHMLPGFDEAWRSEVISTWSEIDAPALRDGGVYWQTTGPRFETPAEIRMIAAHADLVGMTIASECIVAAELGLPYAAVCVVDNLANGVGARELALADLEADREANALLLGEALATILPRLSAASL